MAITHNGRQHWHATPFSSVVWSISHIHRADSRLAPSQWETSLLCNDVSHWLGANLCIPLPLADSFHMNILTPQAGFSVVRSPYNHCPLCSAMVLWNPFPPPFSECWRPEKSPQHTHCSSCTNYRYGYTCNKHLNIEALHIETETKCPPFSRRHCETHFLEWRCMNFDWEFSEVCS